MNTKKYWQWSLFINSHTVQGNVWAIDPRDAASRALCSGAQSGKLIGHEYGIPVDCIQDFPGNDQEDYELRAETFSLRVKVVEPKVQPTTDQTRSSDMSNISVDIKQFDDWGKAIGTKTVVLTQAEITEVIDRAAQLIAVHLAVRRSSGDLEQPLSDLRATMENTGVL